MTEVIDVTMFDVPEKFVTGPELWVSENFIEWVVKPLGQIPKRCVSELTNFTFLLRNVSDLENCEEQFGDIETAKKKAVCPSQLWQLIEAHPSGIGERLVVNIANNFCYVLVGEALFMVQLIWFTGFDKWVVDCMPFNEVEHRKDNLFFSN